ncbi:IS5/IS1182 family transposase, partial [Kitasatospora sp. NPDC001309]
MGRGDLTNDEWGRLAPHLPGSGRRGGRWNDHRRVINGILFR